MVQPISFDNTTEMPGMFKRCTEASDIGLRPGEWPTFLPVTPTEGAYKFGNGCELRRVEELRTPDGELSAVVYRQRFGVMEIHVIND